MLARCPALLIQPSITAWTVALGRALGPSVGLGRGVGLGAKVDTPAWTSDWLGSAARDGVACGEPVRIGASAAAPNVSTSSAAATIRLVVPRGKRRWRP